MELIALDHVSHSYGHHAALKDISLHLAPGTVGLLGPNGAGKSTLLKILMGMLTPTQGDGKLLGENIRTGGAKLRQLIGYMPEADALIPGLRGLEYVSLAGELCGMSRHQAARRAHELLSYLGLEEARYRRLEEYSTGMKQRIKLAQALVHDPPLLLLDEPTSGLDPTGRETMLRLLLTLHREHGKSILLSTHVLGDVEQVCGMVVILHEGRVLRQGKTVDLKTHRRDHYRLQVEANGHLKEFLADLEGEGVQVLGKEGRQEVRVIVPEDWHTSLFFKLADNRGVVLRGLQRDDEDLEELFCRTLQENDGHGA
jgi:ABC-2 type transport system ATP-binding protein